MCSFMFFTTFTLGQVEVARVGKSSVYFVVKHPKRSVRMQILTVILLVVHKIDSDSFKNNRTMQV